jgi:DNA-binding MarR family transcriptional regulator
MTTKDLQKLVEEIGEFEADIKAFELGSFGRWLNDKHNAPPSKKEVFEPKALKEKSFEKLAVERRIGILINRLARFSRNYIRNAFADLPISSYEEFTYLSAVDRLQNPSKSDLNAANLMEPTSGNEIIRRLRKLGLIKEVDDKHDKRIWRIQFTGKGRKVYEEALQRLGNVSLQLSGQLAKDAKVELLRHLTVLEEHHTRKSRKENVEL